ncbi:ankyrin repeat domain-containing protein [Treponema primitia]|uniref:ankyrin repeat domain-containing protein n=1 Tax=Treponema primitia TaxID=88058 RepID=UPI001E4A164B|nr:ankyrin repeat domain-containing protein [Treponema primitia]
MMNTNSANWSSHLIRFFPGLGIVLSLLTSCATPPPPPPPPLVEEIVNDDVWTLLENGEFGAAQKFFVGQTRIDSTDLKGRTPLHIAAEARNPEMTAFFIAQGAKVDLLDRENHTPLSVAVEKRDSASARLLIEAGANIHHPQPKRQTPAVASIAIGGDFLKTVLTPTSLKAVDTNGRTMLHLAAIAGNASSVEIIIDAESNLKTADKDGKTALDLALEEVNSKDHFDVAEKLILAGAFSENPIYNHLAPAVRASNYNTRIGDGIAPLHFAAGEGYTGMAQYLLDKNVDINVKNAAGTTPLHEAARSGNLIIMDLLLQRGADVNAQDAKGNTPMHIGTPLASHMGALSMLLLNGADPNLRDEHGESPLHILISLNRTPETIETILKGGADVSIRNVEGKTPLYLAVQENRVDSIGILLKYKSDLFAADNEGVTPFELALRDNSPVLPALITEETVLQSDSTGNTALHIGVKVHADTDILAIILDRKALVNARNKAGDTSLHIAVREDLQEAGELLIARGADIFANNANGESPLYLSFPEKIPPGKVREWILNSTTVRARDGAGNSILHYAAQWKLDTHIPLIVQKGVNPDVPNAMGEPPLFMAVKVDSRNTVLALLAAGAHIETRDFQGNSCLHAAVRWNAVNAAQTLISKAANVNAHALNGKTPLHDSIRWGIIQMETLLISNGADLEVRDTEGNTPFMEAILAGYRASAERLAEIGADPNTRNNRGDTPLHIAAAQDRVDMVTLLLGWGAKIHAKNIMEKTPFQVALATSPRMVSALLTREWIGVPDDNGHSPLHIAILSNASVEILKTIIDMGGRVSAIDADGKTPLRLALEKDKWDQAKLLADAGSNVFTVAGDGKSPAEIAITKGREAINATFSGRAIAARDPTGNTILHYAAHTGTPDLVSLLIDLGANKTIRNISSESPGDVALKWRRSDIAALLNS